MIETEQHEKEYEDIPSDITEEMITSGIKQAATAEVSMFEPIFGSPQSFDEMLKQMIDAEVNFTFGFASVYVKYYEAQWHTDSNIISVI